MKYIVFSLTIFIFSCSNSENKTETPIAIPSADSMAAFVHKPADDFLMVCSSINSGNINQFIHPWHGLWIIEAPGAMPVMRNVKNMEGNFPIDFSDMKNEELPAVNCDSESFWTKNGCFAMEVNLFADSQIWEHSNLSTEDKDNVMQIVQTVKWTAINTVLHARYYFSMIDGKWYLTFADMRTPCEA